MKLRNLITILFLILTGIVFLFATPAVDIQVFEHRIKWDGLNLKTVTNDKYEGELKFKDGLDLRGGEKYVFAADLSEVEEKNRAEYAEDLAKDFLERLDLYGYKQYELNWKITDEQTIEVELLAPNNNKSDSAIIQLLASKGEFTFWTEDPDYVADEAEAEYFSFLQGMKTANITADDIESLTSLYTSKANGYGFEIQFSKDADDELYMISQSESSRGTMMVVDGQPVGFRTYPIENLASTSSSTKNPIMYMSSLFGESFSINDVLPVLYKTGTMSTQLSLMSEEEVSPLLGDNAASDLKFGMFVALCAVSFILLIKYKKFGIYLIGMMSAFLIWTIFTMKLLNQQLTLIIILGLTVGIIIDIIVSMQTIKSFYKQKNLQPLTTKNLVKLKEQGGYIPTAKYLGAVLLLTMIMSFFTYFEISELVTGLGISTVIILCLHYIAFNNLLPQFIFYSEKYEDKIQQTKNKRKK